MTGRSFTVQARSGAERRRVTRAAILASTLRLLEQGAPLATLSAERITDEAGISRSTFYLHYPDKPALVAALADQELREVRDAVTPLLSNHDANREAIEASIRTLVAAWRSHSAALAAIIELAEYDHETRAVWAAAVEGAARNASEYLATLPAWAGRDVQAVSLALAWMAERLCHQMLRHARPDGDERVVTALTDVVWAVVNAPAEPVTAPARAAGRTTSGPGM